MTRIVLSILTVLTLLGLASCTIQPRPETDDYGNVLVNVQSDIKDYVEAKGYRFGSGAEMEFQEAFLKAEQEIDRVNAKSKQDLLRDYRMNSLQMIDAMIEASQEIDGYHDRNPGVIGEETYMRAKSRLCLWPFCP